MIKLYDQVPQVYNNASRDFQYLSRLFDVVLNDVKHNIDDMYYLPTCSENSRLTELLALTLGFKVKRNYDQKQLSALVSILPSILKCKGTQKAIDLAGNALIKASGAQGSFIGKVVDNVLEVIMPKDSVDVNLFLDILPYILPAGLSVNIVKRNVIQGTIETESGYETGLKAKLFKDYEYAELYDSYEPFRVLPKEEFPFESADDEVKEQLEQLGYKYRPDYHNILGQDTTYDPYVANPGLLDNSIIPILASHEYTGGRTEPETVERLGAATPYDSNSQTLDNETEDKK